MKNNLKMNCYSKLQDHKNALNIMNTVFIGIPHFKRGKLIS